MTHWLEDAVLAVCASPECATPASRDCVSTEELWYELTACILGSQVPNWMGVAATMKLQESRLLIPTVGSSERAIACVLQTPLVSPDGSARRYRFPNTKSRQIAAAQLRVVKFYGSLGALVYSASGEESRRRLIECVPGVGLKQASLFLRNIGVSTDFAILDVHVVRYMAIIGLARALPNSLTTDMYYVLESVLSHYAQCLGFSVGHVDRAIWAVMSSTAAASV